LISLEFKKEILFWKELFAFFDRGNLKIGLVFLKNKNEIKT